jgi:hypothetical protein
VVHLPETSRLNLHQNRRINASLQVTCDGKDILRETKEVKKPDLFQVQWPESVEISFDVDGNTKHSFWPGASRYSEIPDNYIYDGGAVFLGNAQEVRLSGHSTLISSGTSETLIIGTDVHESAPMTRGHSKLCGKLVHYGDIKSLRVGDWSQVIVFGNVEKLSYRSGSQIFIYGTVGGHDFDEGWWHAADLAKFVDLRILPPRHCERIGAVSVVELEPGDCIWHDITEQGIYCVSFDQQSFPVFKGAILHAHALRYIQELVLEVNGCVREGRETAIELAALIEEFARVLQAFEFHDRAVEVLFQCIEILENHLPSNEQTLNLLARLYEKLADSHAALNCHSLALACVTRALCLQAPPAITAITSGLIPSAVSGLQPAALGSASPAVPN